jgi:hypothetical protein
MPLSKGTSDKAREANVEREIAAGKPPAQAAAIAYAVQRRNKRKRDNVGRIGFGGKR